MSPRTLDATAPHPHTLTPHDCPRECPSARSQVASEAWFGGGCDLTPNYLTHTHPDTPEATDLSPDISAFHTFWKDLCDEHSPAIYPRYKRWCDEYFYIPCRKEHRGTGGIFFDDLDPEKPTAGLKPDPAEAWPTAAAAEFDAEAFTRAVGRGIVPSWEGIVAARRGLPFSEEHRTWQELRRGRCVLPRHCCGLLALCGMWVCWACWVFCVCCVRCVRCVC